MSSPGTLASRAPRKFLVFVDKTPESAVALVDQMQLLVPMAGLIDVAADIGRLEKQRA